jgi:hypothetical protein
VIDADEALDRRGDPTVEATVRLEDRTRVAHGHRRIDDRENDQSRTGAEAAITQPLAPGSCRYLCLRAFFFLLAPEPAATAA